MFITCLLLVLEVYDINQLIGNHGLGILWSDLTLGASFKVKRGQPNLKVLITHLLLVLEFRNFNFYEIMDWESFDVVRFDLEPFLKGKQGKPNLKVQI